jgi:hypothetical protein
VSVVDFGGYAYWTHSGLLPPDSGRKIGVRPVSVDGGIEVFYRKAADRISQRQESPVGARAAQALRVAHMLLADGTYDSLIIALVNIIVGAVLAYFLARMNRGQAAADKAAVVDRIQVKEALETNQAEVKSALTEHTTSQDKKLDAIHALVNSAMGAQLKMTADALRAVADANTTPENIQAAEEAEKLYDEHQAKQAVVDASSKT